MKKTILISVIISVSILINPVLANPGYLEISPETYDFGDVELWSQEVMVVTVMNVGINPYEISNIVIYGSSDFSLSESPDLPVILYPLDGSPGNSTIFITVVYRPSSIGCDSANLEIDGHIVSLSGMGVQQEPPPSASIADILAFFDSSLADGTLVGDGSGKSAINRMNALRNMIEAAGDLIEDGYITEAYQQLLDAYQRTDQLPRPPDFVAGAAAPTLASMIFELMESL